MSPLHVQQPPQKSLPWKAVFGEKSSLPILEDVDAMVMIFKKFWLPESMHKYNLSIYLPIHFSTLYKYIYIYTYIYIIYICIYIYNIYIYIYIIYKVYRSPFHLHLATAQSIYLYAYMKDHNLGTLVIWVIFGKFNNLIRVPEI